MRWGYPYVGQDFRFHMTLTGTLSQGEIVRVRPHLQKHFAPIMAMPVLCNRIALCTEPSGAPIVVRKEFILGGRARSKRQPRR